MNSMMYLDSVGDASEAVGTGFLATVMGFFAAYSFLIIALFVLAIIGNWIIYKKAGKPGWASIIPIYATIVKFQIVGISPWLILLFLIPVVGWIAAIVLTAVVAFKLAKVFGKDIAWGFGLWLLPSIFNLILAFGDSKYVGVDGTQSSATNDNQSDR